MSRIDELLAERVPFRLIGDIAHVGTGSSDRNQASVDGAHPFYVRSKQILRINSYEFDETAIVIPGEGGIGEIFHFVSGKYALHQRAYRIVPNTPEVDAKFVYYYFSTHFKRFILQKAVSATVTSIRKPMIAEFRIPIPPLEVQREIVEVLDSFTGLEAALEAELKGELEARRAQYEFYRQLMFQTTGAESVALASLGKWQGGVTPSKASPDYWTNGEIPWLASMDVSDESTDKIRGRVTELALRETPLKIIPAPSIAVVMRSNILRRRLPVGLIVVDTTLNQDIRALVPRAGVDAEYVYQALRAYSEQIRNSCVRTDGSMAAVSSSDFFAWEIPLPSLEEQRRVALELQAFDALVNDLSIGLPAELAARRKQYEYYRDRLLTFKEIAA